MKAGIHPKYEPARITCACGRVTETRSTVGEIHVEICSHCHPFFTGRQKLVDTAGRVERFIAKYGEGSGESGAADAAGEAAEASSEEAAAEASSEEAAGEGSSEEAAAEGTSSEQAASEGAPAEEVSEEEPAGSS